MDSDADNGSKRNDVLSQSYAECVERVAQQKNDGHFNFNLPKEVLEERKKVWHSLFEKYEEEVSDVELDMNTMKPVGENDEEEDEDDEEDDEENEVYTKCRAPLRKLPALIQYWIDTGNPPYQLVGEDDGTETGSSLSEGEHSRSGHSAVIRASSENHKTNSSRCSSVDTAAYILSNTNITKKSETQAIVEGAKSCNENPLPKTSPLKEIPSQAENTKNSTITSPNRVTTPSKISPSKSPADFAKIMSTPLKMINSTILTPELREISSPSQQSVKLSEILPELQEFDKMLERSIAKSSSRTGSSLGKFEAAPKILESKEAIFGASKNSTCRKRLQNRRKLYTGRDSPVDLASERSNVELVQNNRLSLHPALQTTETTRDEKTARLAIRARKRKRKRASKMLSSSQDGNTSQESDSKACNENSKGDARYTDFFESLGLTPSKIGTGKARVGKPLAKRSKKGDRQNPPRKSKDVAPVNDSMESSMKESEDASSPAEKSQNSAEKILGDKILSVRVKRLSDEFLAAFCRKNDETSPIESRSCTISSGTSSGKKNRSNYEKIELLTTLTHDSDSSTILICACNENVAQSNSDASLPSKRVSRVRKIKVSKSAAENKKENVEEGAEKVPVVKLEKLRVEARKMPARLKNEIQNRNSVFRFKTSLSPDKNAKRRDLFAANDSEGVTIGSNIFGEFNSDGKSEKSGRKSRAKSDRFSLGIPIDSDEEEDSFEKLISKIETERDSRNFEGTREENITNKRNLSNGDGRNEAERKHLYVVATTSDEEESNRRTRSFVSRNDKKRRKKTTNSTLEKGEKIENSETAESKEVRRSTRQKVSSSTPTKNLTKNSFVKSKCAKNIFENVQESDSKTQENIPPWDKRDLGFNDENADAENVLDIFGQARNQKDRKIVRKSMKFRTRIDSDSDTEFEGLRFALNEKYVPTKETATEIPKTNGICEKEAEIEISRTSPRKSLKNLSDKRREGKRETKKRGRSVFDESKIMQKNEATDVEDCSKNGNSSLNDLSLHAENVLDISGQARNRKNKKIVRNSMKFRTRTDSDSDTEFEGLRFALNEKYIPTKESVTEIPKTNGICEKEAEIEISRTSPRKTSKSLSAKRREGKRGRTKSGSNLFEESKTVQKNEAMEVEDCAKNGNSSLDDLTTNGTKNSTEKQIKTRSKRESQEGRKTRKNSAKSDRGKNRSIAKQQNEDLQASPISKKKKLQRIKILGNPMDWESEEENDLQNKIITKSEKREITHLRNGRSFEQKKNLFFSPNDTAEDFDLLLGETAENRGADKAVFLDKLNFSSPKKYKNLGVGLRNICFKTKLRSDTEDDGES